MAHSYARSIPRAWSAVAKVFVALGDPHRQRILLMFEPGERLNVSEIAFCPIKRVRPSKKLMVHFCASKLATMATAPFQPARFRASALKSFRGQLNSLKNESAGDK